MHALSRIYRSTLAFKARLSTLMLALPAITVLAFAAAPVAHAQPDITIPTVLIDEANNDADGPTYGHSDDNQVGYGSVSYDYYIGTTEVTNAQYAIFLNAVAQQADTNGLYFYKMAEDVLGGITRSGQEGSYVYEVKEGFENKPVNYVSFYDAARFCNWLTNGATGTADTEIGVYMMGEASWWTRSSDAWETGGYAIPTENEWYKAAYYDLESDTYTTYATGNSITPGDANYNGSTILTDAGYYDLEQNDTFDMMGNVWEWNEGAGDGGSQAWRGGDKGSGDSLLASSYRQNIFDYANYKGVEAGFRVVTLGAVPEPSTYGILGGAAALLGAVALRRRNRRD